MQRTVLILRSHFSSGFLCRRSEERRRVLSYTRAARIIYSRDRESFIPELLDFVFAGLISYLYYEYYGAVEALRLRSNAESGGSAFAFGTIVCPSVTMAAATL